MRKLGERVWLVGLLLLAHCVVSTGCAHRGRTTTAQGPDMGGVVHLATRTAFAQVCPIGPRLGLTSGHVVDPRWWDADAPMQGGYGSTELTDLGRIEPRRASSARDLAQVEPVLGFERWFPVAEAAPTIGAPLYLLGYDYRDQSHLLATRSHRMTLLRIVGKTLVMRGDSQPGSSGGCVCDADGRVVAITEGWIDSDKHERATLAVGVWGETFQTAAEESEEAK